MNRILFLILLCFNLPSIAREVLPYTEIQELCTAKILNPAFEKQQTKKIQLGNGLQAYLISDPHLTKSSASMTVRVGSWDEPKEHPGLAHFLEHMLFLGTEKYPIESSFDRFISQNEGALNGFTNNDHTAYVFTVDHDAYHQTLSMFSEFFKSPLLNASGIYRELHSIDEEYAQCVENDDMRLYHLRKELGNPSHPQSAFSMGNHKTLEKITPNMMKDWFLKNYSANKMILTLSSPYSLDILTRFAVELFGTIPKKQEHPTILPKNVSSQELNGKLISVEPTKKLRTLNLIWELPQNISQMLDSQPYSIISYILGHEGKESLLAQLKKENLATQLSSGPLRLSQDHLEFHIQIELTTKGLREWETVCERCFQTLNLLKENGVPESIFQEIQKINLLEYQYQTREDPFNTITRHAGLIAYEPLATYPEKSWIIQKYSANDIKALLSSLIPFNCQYYLLAPSLSKNNEAEKSSMMDIAYNIQEIPENKMSEWEKAAKHPKIILPVKNPFIPNSLTLFHPASNPNFSLRTPSPQKILDNDEGIIYYAQDAHYRLPTIGWIIEIKTPAIRLNNPSSIALGDLYIKNVLNALREECYQAKLAGLNLNLERTANGIKLFIDGYDQKAKNLLKTVLATMKSPPENEAQFKQWKEELLFQYDNFSKESPITQCSELFKTAIFKESIRNKTKASQLRKLKYPDYQHFIKTVYDETYLEGTLYGNLTESTAHAIVSNLQATFNRSPYRIENHAKKEVTILPQDKGPFYLEEKLRSQGNSIILAIQFPDFSLKKRAAQQVLMQAIKEPFYTTLRTIQQTGYLVSSKGEEFQQKLFNLFAVQSNSYDARDLLARFELFIEDFLQNLPNRELPEQSFEHLKEVMVHHLQIPPENQFEMTNLLHTLAFEHDGNFNLVNERIEALKNLNYQEFITFAEEMLGKKNRRRIAILSKGKSESNGLEYKKVSINSLSSN